MDPIQLLIFPTFHYLRQMTHFLFWGILCAPRGRFLGLIAKRKKSDHFSFWRQQSQGGCLSPGRCSRSPELCVFSESKGMLFSGVPDSAGVISVWSAFPLIRIDFREEMIRVQLWAWSWGDFMDFVWTFVLSVPLHALLMNRRSFKDTFVLKQTAGCSTLQFFPTTVARTERINFPPTKWEFVSLSS